MCESLLIGIISFHIIYLVNNISLDVIISEAQIQIHTNMYYLKILFRINFVFLSVLNLMTTYDKEMKICEAVAEWMNFLNDNIIYP